MFKRKRRLQEPESFEKAYDYAVFLLSIRLRTVGEVRQKMGERGFAEKTIAEVISSLLENRYLDDQRFAEIFLDNLKKYKSFGYYGIKKKFLEKRLPKELIEQVLEAGLPKDEEIKIAERFLKKESLSVKSKSDLLIKKKIAQRLQARGFRGEIISKLIF